MSQPTASEERAARWAPAGSAPPLLVLAVADGPGARRPRIAADALRGSAGAPR